MRFWDKDFDRWWITWGSYFILLIIHYWVGSLSDVARSGRVRDQWIWSTRGTPIFDSSMVYAAKRVGIPSVKLSSVPVKKRLNALLLAKLSILRIIYPGSTDKKNMD